MRQEVKDNNYRTLGWIETGSDGEQTAMDANYRTLGHYDPRTDETRDSNYRIIARGNVLSALIYNQR